jgi:recombination protein RecR
VARYAEPMARLIDELKKLPGVGTKTAQRFAFHILRSSDDDASGLAEAVRGLKASLRLCSLPLLHQYYAQPEARLRR